MTRRVSSQNDLDPDGPVRRRPPPDFYQALTQTDSEAQGGEKRL